MAFQFLPQKTLKSRLFTFFDTDAEFQLRHSIKDRTSRLARLKPIHGETLQQAAAKRLEFGRFYFPKYISFPYAPFHSHVLENLQIRGRLVIEVLPRNAGKGTMAFLDNMYDTAFEAETYIVRIEHDSKAAKNESFKIAHEWTSNVQLMRDFPHILPGSTWQPGGGELRFQNGLKFQSVGLKELIRGLTELQSRISKVQVNDPVKNAQEARSHVHTQDVYDLVLRSVAKAGGSMQENPISYCVLGTCQAQGDALDHLMRSQMAKVHKIPALIGEATLIDELLDCLSVRASEIRRYCDELEQNTGNVNLDDRERYFKERWDLFAPFFALKSYWAVRFPLPDLFFDAASDTGAFAQEMLHLTEDVKYIKFQDAWFQEYDLRVPDGQVIYGMGIDPSGEPKEGSDPMAIYAGGYHTGLERAYTLETWCDQATPQDLFEQTYAIFNRCFPWYQPGDESVFLYMEDIVSFSGGILTYFETERQNRILKGGDPAYWCQLPFVRIIPGSLGNKMQRILSLRPIAEQERIFVNRQHSHQKILVEQAVHFNGQPTHKPMPPEFKVDLLDAFQMWFHHASQGAPMAPYAAYGDD